jgi:hypothetical protein
MKNVALITGASSGIGKELARIHASRGGDMVIVARREKELKELKNELEANYKVKVKVIAKDLSKPEAASEIYQAVISDNIRVEYLINNAGFGGHGAFHERKWTNNEAMINVNIMSLTALTRMFLPDMVRTNSGKILNVSSTAGFIPGPFQAVYNATKAYVNSFSQAIAEELRDTNITVTALCPSATETGFQSASNMEGIEIFKKADSAYDVALGGYNAMMKGKLMEFSRTGDGLALKFVLPLLPAKSVLKISKRLMEKKNGHALEEVKID